MKRTLLLLVFCGLTLNASADVLISQFYEGTSSNKWIELVNTDASAVSLAGYSLTLWSNANAEAWKVDGGSPNNTQDLSAYSIPANGNLLLANSSAVLPAYATFDLTSSTTNFNGNDSLVLYNTALGSVGDTVAIGDALAFTNGGNEGGNTSFYRLTNGVGFDLTVGNTVLDYPAVWGEKTNAEVDSAVDTDDWYLKNTALFITDSLTITLSPMTVAEDAGVGAVDITLMRSGDTTAALDVTVESDDASEATIPTAVLTIPATQASATFTMAIDIVDDTFVDGSQMVTISASAPGLFGDDEALTVTDAGDSFVLVLNEVYYAVDPTTGDVNGDSLFNSDDEFVEIINVSGGTLDLTDYTLSDSGSTRHTFRTGTILEPGCSIVVFGGNVVEGTTAAFGEAEVQVASNGGLFLNDDGDVITIFDETDTEVATLTLPDASTDPELGSLNLSVDGVGASPYDRHATLTDDPADQFSPGVSLLGAAYCDVTETLTVSLSPTTIGEDAAAGSVTATLTLSTAVPTGLPFGGQFFAIATDDATELVVDGTSDPEIFVLEGMTTGTIVMDPVNDSDADGTQTVTVTVWGSNYLSGTTMIEVTDDNDVPLDGDLFFSESAEGSGDNKYLEIYNPTAVTISLDGYAYPNANGGSDGTLEYWNAFEAGATIAPGEVYIICHSSANSEITDKADEFHNFLSNGDDGYALVKGSETNFEVLDWVGDWGPDPGAGWEVAGVTNATKDHVLVRKNSVSEGNPDWDAARGTDETDSEWIVLDNENWSSLGTHPNVDAADLVITASSFNFTTNEVTLTVAGMEVGATYSLDHSTDLDQVDAWESIGAFGTDFGATETFSGSGIYNVTVTDAELETETVNFYRVSEQE